MVTVTAISGNGFQKISRLTILKVVNPRSINQAELGVLKRLKEKRTYALYKGHKD